MLTDIWLHCITIHESNAIKINFKRKRFNIAQIFWASVTSPIQDRKASKVSLQIACDKYDVFWNPTGEKTAQL